MITDAQSSLMVRVLCHDCKPENADAEAKPHRIWIQDRAKRLNETEDHYSANMIARQEWVRKYLEEMNLSKK